MKIVKIAFLALTLGLLSGCSIARVKPGSEPIKISFDLEEVRHCTRIGEVVGSSGHWYDSWVIANDILTIGALNDLRNKSYALGADTVFVPNHALLFATSVTVLGQAFRCGDRRSSAQ